MGWSGLEWSGQDWAGLSRTGLEWAGLGWSGLDRAGVGRTGLNRARLGRTGQDQHVLFPTIYNNSKVCIVLQLIIIVICRASLKTKQYYWLKNCLLALRARSLAKFGKVDTVPVSENSFNNN